MTDSPPTSETDVPPPSAPESFGVSLLGFAGEAEAREFANLIGLTIRAISRYINLQRLDGVTVAYDYDEALVELDRGYLPTRTLTRIANDYMLGVAMAPAVLRDGAVKGHLVFHAPAVLPLQDESNELYGQTLYLIAHECAHLQDLKDRDECFPGTILQQQITDYEEAVLEQVSGALWEEYAACYASAPFGNEQAAAYEETFVSALSVARERAHAAILEYRWHGDISRVLEEAGNPLCEPLRIAAYLFGHLDGRGEDLDSVPRARIALIGSPYESFVDRLVTILRDLWLSRGQWASEMEFVPLHDLAREVLAYGGLILERRPDGTLYVNIPFTPETTP